MLQKANVSLTERESYSQEFSRLPAKFHCYNQRLSTHSRSDDLTNSFVETRAGAFTESFVNPVDELDTRVAVVLVFFFHYFLFSFRS